MSATEHRNAAKQKVLEAIESGDAGRVKAALDRGVSPDAIHLGLRMLAHAIRQPEFVRAKAAEALLCAGADPNLSDVLSAAAAVGDARVSALLLDAGAVVNGRSERFRPLAHAALHGHREVVDLLLSRGADVDGRCVTFEGGSRPVTGCTPLMMAAVGGHDEIVRRLLAAGADPAALDSDGHTALAWTKLDKNKRTQRAREVLESAGCTRRHPARGCGSPSTPPAGGWGRRT